MERSGAMMHDDEVSNVRALAARALRARLSSDLPVLQQISTRWLVYRLQALMDTDEDRVGEFWHWSNPGDAEHDDVWTAVRVWNGDLPPADVTYQDFPDGTQHAFVPFSSDEDYSYVVVCQCDDGMWRYHDTTRTRRDAAGTPLPSAASTSTSLAGAPRVPMTSSIGFGGSDDDGADADDDYWSKYDEEFAQADDAALSSSSSETIQRRPFSAPNNKQFQSHIQQQQQHQIQQQIQQVSRNIKQPRPVAPVSAAAQTHIPPRKASPISRHSPSAFTLQREKQLREAIRQSIKGVYQIATLNGISAGEFVSLAKDVCEL